MDEIVSRLLTSDEPSIRYKTMVNFLGKAGSDADVRRIRAKIKLSSRVKGLLAGRNKNGRIPVHPYSKWYGAHWILVALADLDYPPRDKEMIPLREQTYAWLFSKEHAKYIRIINGLTRRCGSQEGNALYSTLHLGIADERADELAHRLYCWQWPDGGWNCDKKIDTHISSFRETIVPLRALALHAHLTGSKESKTAAARAAQLLLGRRLFQKHSDGSIMRESFVKLHYPRYYEYDILFALVVLAEAGFIHDERCSDALDLLESKRLPNGGFPCEEKLYRVAPIRDGSRVSPIDWGGTSKTKINEFITVDTLYVLKSSGRRRSIE